MWIGEGAGGGRAWMHLHNHLAGIGSPIAPPAASAGAFWTRPSIMFYGDAPFLNNTRKAHLPCMQALQQFGAPVLLPVEMLVKAGTLPEVNGLLPAILYTRPRAACHKIV